MRTGKTRRSCDCGVRICFWNAPVLLESLAEIPMAPSAFSTHCDKPVVLDPSVKLASIRENHFS
jgi:hypothetical protein